MHAHITLLAPWADRPTAADLAHVARIARRAGPFDVQLAAVGELTATIDRIDLQWWANHDCRRLNSWPLGMVG